MMLDMLSENPQGLDALIDSIQMSRSQNFIIAKITDEVQKAKSDKIDSLRGWYTKSYKDNQMFLMVLLPQSCLHLYHSTAEASSSSSDYSLTTPGTTSDLYRTFSNESTMLVHPDGEKSPATSDVGGSLLQPSLQKGVDLTSLGRVSMVTPSSVSSSSLPKPGDPGAPPLPEEIQVESTSDVDPGAQGCTSTGGDPNFQPLRSRSLTPTSNRNVF